MWFKNLTLFRFIEPFTLSTPELARQLEQAAFRGCGSYELLSQGWVPPLGRRATEHVHPVGGRLLVCLQTEEKVLPAAVVKELVAEKVAAIEDQEMRRVFRKEKARFQEEIFQELLPQAFTRNRRSYAYIDPGTHWLVVDSASRKTVDELTKALRRTLGSLPVRPLQVATAPSAVLTEWIATGEIPASLTLEDECELRDAGEQGGVVRCKGQDLTGEEIQAHLKAGKQVTRLGLNWNERIAFLLEEDFRLRRLRFLDLVQQPVDSIKADTAEAQSDAEFILMTEQLAEFLPHLLTFFGGEVTA